MPAHTGEGRSPLLSVLMQILTVSRKTHTDTPPPRNKALPVIWESFSPVKLTHKISHYKMDPEGQMVAIWNTVSFQQSIENINEIKFVKKSELLFG